MNDSSSDHLEGQEQEIVAMDLSANSGAGQRREGSSSSAPIEAEGCDVQGIAQVSVEESSQIGLEALEDGQEEVKAGDERIGDSDAAVAGEMRRVESSNEAAELIEKGEELVVLKAEMEIKRESDEIGEEMTTQAMIERLLREIIEKAVNQVEVRPIATINPTSNYVRPIFKLKQKIKEDDEEMDPDYKPEFLPYEPAFKRRRGSSLRTQKRVKVNKVEDPRGLSVWKKKVNFRESGLPNAQMNLSPEDVVVSGN